jgi:hypothetical protein
MGISLPDLDTQIKIAVGLLVVVIVWLAWRFRNDGGYE